LAFAQGWVLDTDYLASADIRSWSTINNAGDTRNPPNLQSLTLTGFSAGDTGVAYRSTGAGLTTILRAEFDVGVVGSGNNQSADSTMLLGANTRTVSPTPSDVPETGTIRVLDPNDTGNYLRFPYTSRVLATNIYTLAATIGSVTGSVDLTLDDNAHIELIGETVSGTTATNTMQYVADIPIVYKGRIKGIKPFRGTTTFTATGASAPVTRQADAVVDLP
jgi:hypothetical protein